VIANHGTLNSNAAVFTLCAGTVISKAGVPLDTFRARTLDPAGALNSTARPYSSTFGILGVPRRAPTAPNPHVPPFAPLALTNAAIAKIVKTALALTAPFANPRPRSRASPSPSLRGAGTARLVHPLGT
jgi:hypothetical protein